ncbi:hypothetical protein BHM03_00009011 [Ensete ventricosum]|nr:hypothetical protein BHM03_00009011 [Ensete ventricosum]
MGVAEDCRDTFLELQRKKTHRYVIFKIDEKRKQVIVEKTGDATESYDDFMASLPENDCRYAVYDFDFHFYLVLHLLLLFCTPVHLLALQFKGIIVVFSHVISAIRSPSVSRIRAKMLYATSKDRFRREMDGVHYEIQATDPSELDLEILRDRAH